MAVNAESLARRIQALKVGASLSVTRRLEAFKPIAAVDGAGVLGVKRLLKNHVAPHVMRARTYGGGTFTVDTCAALNHDCTHVLVSATVTRLTAETAKKARKP